MEFFDQKLNSWLEFGWTLDTDSRNFGDLLLRESAGILLDFHKITGNSLSGGFFGGSVLNPYFVDLVNSKILSSDSIFWGCGISNQNSIPILNSRNKIFGVRGKISESVINHAEAIGDPGLLAPLALCVWPKKQGHQVIFIPHYNDDFIFTDDRVAVLSVRVPLRSSSKILLKEIARAKFVLTGSLHVAICAFVLGTPFGLYSNGYIDNEIKFHDFASMNELEIAFFDNIDEAVEQYFNSGNFNCRPSYSDAKKLLEVVRPFISMKGRSLIILWPLFLSMRNRYVKKKNRVLLKDLTALQ